MNVVTVLFECREIKDISSRKLFIKNQEYVHLHMHILPKIKIFKLLKVV